MKSQKQNSKLAVRHARKADFATMLFTLVLIMAGAGSRAFAQFNTPALDGVISAGEYGTHTDGNNQQTNGGTTWYMTWDATNLYIGVSGANVLEGAVIYVDGNPTAPINGGTNANGTLVGQGYDNTNFAALQFRADHVSYFKDGYREHRTADGSNGWTSATTFSGSYWSNGSNVREYAIPWSNITGGLPASFNWFGYVTSSTGFVYGEMPTENGGGFIGTSARESRYFTVSATGNGTSTKPFSRNSFVFNSATDLTGFGAISVYDFTMNSSGRQLFRATDASTWTIAGNLRVDAGTIHFDNNTGAATVSGNVVMSSGGTLNLGNVIGGDLNLAGNWTNNGTFNSNNRTVTFNGSGTQTVSGSSTTNFGFVTVNMSSSAGIAEMLSPITMTTDGLTLTQGTFKLSSASTITPFAGSTTIPSVAGFHLNHASAVSNWGSTGSLTLQGKLILDAGAITVGSASGNELTLNTSTSEATINGGTLNLASRISVTSSSTGNGLRINGGEVVLPKVGNASSSNTFNMGSTGKFTMTGGTVTIERGGTGGGWDVNMVTTGNKSITGGEFRFGNASTPAGSAMTLLSEVALFNLTLNNAAGVTLQNDATINNTLNFITGNLTTGALNTIIGSSGSVTRTSGHVVGNLRKSFGVGANVSRSFEIGTGTDYAPVDITIANVSGAGTMTLNTSAGDHASIGSSTLNASKSVNRRWSVSASGLSITTYSATFNFVNSDLDVGVNTNALVVGEYSGGWTYPTVGTRTSTSTQATGIGTFGEFQLAECTPPSVSFSPVGPYCENDAAVDLTAFVSPSGGTFSGTGVTSAGVFTPSSAGAGTHTITYSFTSASNCTNTASQDIVVNSLPSVSFSAVSAVCLNASAIDLTSYVSPSGGTFSGTGVTSTGIFTPSSAGIGTHTITYSFTDGNSCTNTASQDIQVETLPTVTFDPAGPYCVNGAVVDLTAFVSPSGGTFSGTGVTSAGMFTPSIAGVGTHTITYTFTSGSNCTNSASQDIVVNPLPSVSFTAVAAVCLNASAIDLTSYVSPSGGTFSGDGVTTAGIFTPSSAGAGTHTITYSFTDGNSCSNTASQDIVVNPLPTVTFTSAGPYCLNSPAVDLTSLVSPSGGTFSGTGVTSAGIFTPSTAGIGTHTITYSFTDGNSCTNTASLDIKVETLPTVTFDPAGPYCVNAAAVDLTTFVSPAGGTFSGDGVTSAGIFTPSTAGVGTHTITYTFTSGSNCTNSANRDIVVNSLPSVTFNAVSAVCANASAIDLTSYVSPTGGTFSGDGVTSAGIFTPSTAGTGTHTITYSFTDGNSCTNTASQDIVVNPLPTVTFNAVGPFLVTDAPVDLSSAVSPSGGTFSGSGISGTMFDPSAAGVGTHTITYSFTDGNSCTNSASRNITVNSVTPPTVKPFVFLANKLTLKSTKQTTPAGDMHSNGTLTVEKGKPSTYNSNLTAVGKITINKQNTINGNVKSQTSVSNSGTITGTKSVGAVNTEALPSLSFTAGGDNKTVPTNGALTLAPGSYGIVTMNNNSTLKLTSGEYFMNELRYSSTIVDGTIEIDLSSGNPVMINVVTNLQLGHDAAIVLLPNGESDSPLVTFNTMQSTAANWGREAYLLGSFNAPNAIVTLVKNSQLRGSICAKEILVSNDCLFLHHDSPGSLPGPGNLPKSSFDDEEEADSYQLSADSYALEQNYPNPFNPTTVISFQLPVNSDVTLSIFNTSGQLVKKLVAGEMNAGQHTFTWDATNERGERAASGVYLYVLKAGEFTARKKLVLMK